MVQYLSDEWIQRAGEALAASEALRAACADSDVVIQYDVTGAPGGKRSYAVRLEHGTASIGTGAHDGAAVSFGLDYDTATAIARGELSAQAAFMQGRLKLGGDITTLVRQYTLLDGLDDALAALRSTTEY